MLHNSLLEVADRVKMTDKLRKNGSSLPDLTLNIFRLQVLGEGKCLQDAY